MYRPDREKKDGTFPLVLRITIGRSVKYIPIGYDVHKNKFDSEKERVKGSDGANWNKNLSISNALSKVSSIEKYFLKHDKKPTMNEFVKLYSHTDKNPDSLYSFIDYLIKIRQSTLAPSTIDFYKKNKGKLQEFKSSINLTDIDLAFIHEYQNHLIKKGNSEIYVNKSLEFVRRVLNAALKNDMIQKNPFIHFPIKSVKGTIEPLNKDELTELEKIYCSGELPRHLQNVLRYFLFCCYTGLRHSDVKSLRFNQIEDHSGVKWIVFSQKKTKKFNKVPLIRQAVDLLPEKKIENQKVFRVLTVQATGRNLHKILAPLNINKHITFHSSRHTFSNLLYRMGIPIELRALIIGDTEDIIKDTYTKPAEDMILDVMNKYSIELTQIKSN